MLVADKLQLQSQLRQQAVSLKEKEFNLHHSNLMTVGTQAAVLAGLDITMFIEFTPAPLSEWIVSSASSSSSSVSSSSFAIPTWSVPLFIPRCLTFVYYTMITAAFCSNMMVVAQTTALSVLGAGLALRGPDGSMMTATDALYYERQRVFSIFGRGLAWTVTSVLIGVWLMLPWETALACCSVAAYTCYTIYANYDRVAAVLDFDERDTVDFRDIMEGPGNVRLYTGSNNNNNSQHQSKTQKQQPYHQPRSQHHRNSSRSSQRPQRKNSHASDTRHQSNHNSSRNSTTASHYSTNNDDYNYNNDYNNNSEEGSYSSHYTDDVEMQSRQQQQQQQPFILGGGQPSSRRRGKNDSAMQTV